MLYASASLIMSGMVKNRFKPCRGSDDLMYGYAPIRSWRSCQATSVRCPCHDGWHRLLQHQPYGALSDHLHLHASGDGLHAFGNKECHHPRVLEESRCPVLAIPGDGFMAAVL